MDNLSVFWFRRDLRLDDNAGLYHALKSKQKVLPLFIFDKNILDELEPDDSRVTFIYDALLAINKQLKEINSSLLIYYGKPDEIWSKLIEEYPIKEVFTNHDYEPYAKERDSKLKQLFDTKNIAFHTFKDQCIFEKNEVLKDDGKPYVVFTPYKRRWLQKLNSFFIKPYPNKKYFNNFYPLADSPKPSLEDMGFVRSSIHFPDKSYQDILPDYAVDRDYPAK